MKLLIIGGTRFLGLHLVAAAVARNHEITLFNRGTHAPPALANVETIKGDRSKELSRLAGRRWDAVIDTCGYLPRTVRASAEMLAASVDRYVFISSISAYANFDSLDVNETAPLATLTPEQVEQANEIDTSGPTSAGNYGKLYGGLKAHCEQAVEQSMPGRVLIIRPGLVVGPYDYSDRFTYWVRRLARGGEVLAPGRPDRYVQFIDARDLAEWTLRMVERKERGFFNANGPRSTLTMEKVLEECKAASRSDACLTWTSDSFLLQEGIIPWSEMPLWMPEDVPHMKGFMFVNCEKALAAGLSFRPIEDTISGTLTWHKAAGITEELKAGLDADKEQHLLRKWRQMHLLSN